MLTLPRGVRVYVATEPVDMRRQFDGLANTVRDAFGDDPESGHLFFFANRKRHLIKVIFFDKQGYCLLAKRLESGTFPMPKSDGAKLEISVADFADLLRAKRISESSDKNGTRRMPMVRKERCSGEDSSIQKRSKITSSRS